jgi:outer membrane immunogenic protein
MAPARGVSKWILGDQTNEEVPAATVALASISAPALAADLGARPTTTTRPPMPRRSTTGPVLYRRHIGGAFSGSNSFNGLVLNDHNSRLMGGVQAGADWQFAPSWVAGVRPVLLARQQQR